jgi:hypothetical protein
LRKIDIFSIPAGLFEIFHKSFLFFPNFSYKNFSPATSQKKLFLKRIIGRWAKIFSPTFHIKILAHRPFKKNGSLKE